MKKYFFVLSMFTPLLTPFVFADHGLQGNQAPHPKTKVVKYGCMAPSATTDEIRSLVEANFPKACPLPSDPLKVVCFAVGKLKLGYLNSQLRKGCIDTCERSGIAKIQAEKICGYAFSNTTEQGAWCTCSCPDGSKFCWNPTFPPGRGPATPWQP